MLAHEPMSAMKFFLGGGFKCFGDSKTPLQFHPCIKLRKQVLLTVARYTMQLFAAVRLQR